MAHLVDRDEMGSTNEDSEKTHSFRLTVRQEKIALVQERSENDSRNSYGCSPGYFPLAVRFRSGVSLAS